MKNFSLVALLVLVLAFALLLRFSGVLGFDFGLIQPSVYIAGTGSMYPTFPKGNGKTNLDRINEVVGSHKIRSYPGGIEVAGRRWFGYQLQRGDIVSFANNKTRQIVAKEVGGEVAKNASFIKRLIALPGDTIEIRDGFVKLNGQALNEPYIASGRSTYGGDFLPDCQALKIPTGHVFVMGDNRKGSDDSRFEVGLVAVDDIQGVIPINEQADLKSHYRDTSSDLASANKPVLDAKEYLDLLNQKRQANNLPLLKYQEKLAQSAKKRADNILKYDDLSFEATRSGYTMNKALADVGYSNITYGEAPAFGFYTAEELLDNSFQFANSKNFLLKKDFQEIGITAEEGEINGCPVQVVVQHLAGYIPPNYSQDQINNIGETLAKLKQVQPGWQSLTSSGDFYKNNQADIDRLNYLIDLQIKELEQILSTMTANQWLSKDEQTELGSMKSLSDEESALSKKLNSK